MKSKFPISALSKILSTLFCLIWLNHSAICQSVTESNAFGSGFDLSAKLPEIVRDLKVCDLIKIERDTQAKYIQSLTGRITQLETSAVQIGRDRDKYERKTKRRGKLACAVIVAATLEAALIFLLL